MKIANKIRFASLGLFLGAVLAVYSQPSWAVNGADSIPLSSSELSSGGSGETIKEPEAIKKVVKKLATTTENLSVEDLNAAREAVAKLDVLIDIEKRLNDLADIRAERDEKNAASAAAAIPPAIIAPPAPIMPPEYTMPAPVVLAPPPPPPVMDSPVEVDRVVGATGRYVAYLRVSGDPVKQVRVGDKISDGSLVDSISPYGVTLSRDKKSRTVKVNNPAPVFGAKK